MTLTSRVSGYAVGATLASLIYIGWFIMESMHSDENPDHLGFGFWLLLALFFWFVEGFALSLVVMIAPWILAVFAYGKFRRFGQFYFPAVGASILFTVSCGVASISPKPLFIEDQTFLQGAVIAAQRQGLCFILAGIALGACYWFFGERQIPAQKQPQTEAARS